MTYESRTPFFVYASLILNIITIILVFGPKQAPCLAPMPLSIEQVPGSGYVFSTPNVAARRATQQSLTDRMCAKGYPGPGGKADCDAAKKLRATMPKTNTGWGIPPGGQVISG